MAYNYARRVELARARGFVDPTGKSNPYSYYRKVTEYANSQEQFVTMQGGYAGVATDGEELNLDDARILYEAFVLGDEDDYTINMSGGEPVIRYDKDGKPKGAKAVALIKVLGYVPSAAAWRRLYPTKTRFGHLIEKPKGRGGNKAPKKAKRVKKYRPQKPGGGYRA